MASYGPPFHGSSQEKLIISSSNSGSSSATPNAATNSATTSGNASPDLDGIGASEDIIDWSIFSQILDMDEDEDREFSTGIVTNYFEQAETTFSQMQSALLDRNLDELSSLGHFLKGSSAALGLSKVQASCEKIQHLGARKDDSGELDVNDDDLSLSKIKQTLDQVQTEFLQTRKYLTAYFGL